MKKIFEIIGLLSLVMFSFFVTEKTSLVVKNADDIMIQIKDNYKNYETKSQNAIIDNNTITPGISGRKININKSYRTMKEYGKYNDDLYVYDMIKPKISIKNNKDKLITSGSKSLRQVSLIFILNNNSNITNILNVLDDNNVKGNFFINEEWLTNNNYTAIDLIETGYTLGINSNDNYNSWVDTIIKHVGKQKEGYCLYIDVSTIKKCLKLNNYTVRPYIYDKNYLMHIEKDISNGSIIGLKDNNELYKELDSVIKYITSKGYNIVSLEQILTE